MVLRKELVQVHQKYASQEEALRSIAQTFVDLGVVKESFPQAIIDREAVYPTGLPASEFDIAISHCDSDHVNESAIGAVVLDEPVEFEMMGGMGDGPLSVRLIFMLAIKDPKAAGSYAAEDDGNHPESAAFEGYSRSRYRRRGV